MNIFKKWAMVRDCERYCLLLFKWGATQPPEWDCDHRVESVKQYLEEVHGLKCNRDFVICRATIVQYDRRLGCMLDRRHVFIELFGKNARGGKMVFNGYKLDAAAPHYKVYAMRDFWKATYE